MTSKLFRARWLFPILSLAVGLVWLGCFLWFGDRFAPFFGLWIGLPNGNFFGNFFLGLGVPALLASLFGFLRAKPKEIWSYGFLTWAPQAVFGAVGATGPGMFAPLGLVLAASCLLAAVVGVIASYAGFALRKVVNRIRADPEEPSSILRK